MRIIMQPTYFLLVLVSYLALFFPRAPFAQAYIEMTHSHLTPNAKTHVNIAAILPKNNSRLFSINRVAPAIKIAIDWLRANTETLSSINVTVRYGDSQCDISEAINVAFNFFLERKADVYFGPVCDYAAAPVSRQARYWDLPLLTPGAMSADFGFNKLTQYRTLTRLGSELNAFSLFLLDVMRHFGWQRAKQLYQPDGQNYMIDKFCHIAATSIHSLMLSNKNFSQGYAKIHELDTITQQYVRTEIGNEFAE